MKRNQKNDDVTDVSLMDPVSSDDNIEPNAKGHSNIPIIILGVAALAAMTFLTYFASSEVLRRINLSADTAYAESYSKYAALINSQRLAMQERARAAKAKEEAKSKLTVAGYSSADLVEVDGEWYISSALVNTYKGGGNEIPVIVDPETTIMVSGEEYMHIENPEDISSSVAETVPFYGSEYVVVDIDGNMVYLVKKGDTLSDVSGRVGYSVQELAEFNNVKNVNLIYEGQTLRVPAPQEAIDYVAAQQNAKGTGGSGSSQVKDGIVSSNGSKSLPDDKPAVTEQESEEDTQSSDQKEPSTSDSKDKKDAVGKEEAVSEDVSETTESFGQDVTEVPLAGADSSVSDSSTGSTHKSTVIGVQR